MPNKLDTRRKTLQTGSLFTEVRSMCSHGKEEEAESRDMFCRKLPDCLPVYVLKLSLIDA
jgi:hypothetical protein